MPIGPCPYCFAGGVFLVTPYPVYKNSKEESPLVSLEQAEYKSRYGVTPENADHDTLLKMISDMMTEGLETVTEPFPESDREFAGILDELRPLSANELRAKLVISGWLLTPYGEDQMRCQECMYYLVHKRWCDLPELDLPAEPEWWCRLWRI